MAFLAKNWQKYASQNATRALCRVAGAGVAAYALNKLTTGATTNAQTTIKNIAGPAAVVVGVMGDLMLEDDKLRSACQGIYTFGALKSLAVVAPSVAQPLGLSGLGSCSLAAPAILNGETTATTTVDVPDEIKAISQGAKNDGNDWKAVADYIENGGDEAVEVTATSRFEDNTMQNFTDSMAGVAQIAASMN